MFVLSRQKDDSVMVGDDLLVTVSAIRGASALIVISRGPLGGRLRAFECIAQARLGRDGVIPLGDDASCTIVDIAGDKVRLGLDVPAALSVHRKEVYDAIRKESQRNRGDDDDDHTAGSPVPR